MCPPQSYFPDATHLNIMVFIIPDLFLWTFDRSVNLQMFIEHLLYAKHICIRCSEQNRQTSWKGGSFKQ